MDRWRVLKPFELETLMFLWSLHQVTESWQSFAALKGLPGFGEVLKLRAWPHCSWLAPAKEPGGLVILLQLPSFQGVAQA